MPIWNDLITRGCLAVLPGEWNWFSGAVRRALLASHADVLITLGGGEGVEHYGSLFQARSKPVIPLDLQIGSSSNDGRGGSLRILDRVRSDPRLFFPLLAPDTVNAHLESLATRQGLTTATEIADGVIRFLRTISPPTAFYVRLLNSETSEFDAVEQFFRTVVDPFVCRLDYTPVQMGRTPASKPFLNVEIFTRIHESTLVIADLIGMRPNCLVELGYALALGRQVVVSAMKGTDMPFDIQSVDQFIWDPEASDDSTLVKLDFSRKKVCAGRIRTTVPTPGYNIQSLFRILAQHTVALKCAKSLELPQNGFLRENQDMRMSWRAVASTPPPAWHTTFNRVLLSDPSSSTSGTQRTLWSVTTSAR